MARQAANGPEVLVKNEFDAALIDVQLSPVQNFIALVTAHRDTLQS